MNEDKPSWDEVKDYIEMIDNWDCHQGEVAKGLQLLVRWIEQNIEKQSEMKIQSSPEKVRDV